MIKKKCLEKVQKYSYLGTNIYSNNSLETKYRIRIATESFKIFENIHD